MHRSIIPVNIRPHLVPFLYQEFEGIEENYLDSRVKAAKISTRTVLGKIIRLLAEKSEKPLKAKSYNVFLSVRNKESCDFFGSVYKYQSGSYSFLRLPEEGCRLLNDHLEDTFRLVLVSFVLGYVTKKEQGDVAEALNIFLDSFNLREFGYSEPTIRRMYDRELQSGAILKRLQKSISNRVLNYV
ncbi:hypothetical protein CJ739_96 [Mariniflexile rhizosphaerae]|uniref:hypothetical protein n=1 Tax=unclassified Mariniflexile TaxID=2643887 RepID=UPI000E3354CB|nr:hypothetical protein [Mariniflexile sp. TRM1-10]AXP79196.1 hypothetical protein CJ739_96 [Mariniflexile sp. TRM1-10]